MPPPVRQVDPDATPEQVAAALLRPRTHEAMASRLLAEGVLLPDELDDLTADEIEVSNVLLDVVDDQRRAGPVTLG